jgi:hypothetical protein
MMDRFETMFVSCDNLTTRGFFLVRIACHDAHGFTIYERRNVHHNECGDACCAISQEAAHASR